MAANNPAGRLLALVRRAKTAVEDKHKPNTVFDLWAVVFGTNHLNGGEIVRKLNAVHHLITSVLRQLKANNASELVLQRIEALQDAIGQTPMGTAPHALSSKIDEGVVATLEYLDEVWSKQYSDTVADNADLDHLRDCLSELQKEIDGSECDPELRLFLMKHLDIMDRAILDYEYIGPQETRNALSGFVGELQLTPSLHESFATSRSARDTVSFLSDVNGLVDLGFKGVALAALLATAGIKLLES